MYPCIHCIHALSLSLSLFLFLPLLGLKYVEEITMDQNVIWPSHLQLDFIHAYFAIFFLPFYPFITQLRVNKASVRLLGRVNCSQESYFSRPKVSPLRKRERENILSIPVKFNPIHISLATRRHETCSSWYLFKVETKKKEIVCLSKHWSRLEFYSKCQIKMQTYQFFPFVLFSLSLSLSLCVCVCVCVCVCLYLCLCTLTRRVQGTLWFKHHCLSGWWLINSQLGQVNSWNTSLGRGLLPLTRLILKGLLSCARRSSSCRM